MQQDFEHLYISVYPLPDPYDDDLDLAEAEALRLEDFEADDVLSAEWRESLEWAASQPLEDESFFYN